MMIDEKTGQDLPPTLRATHDHVILRPITTTKSSGAHGEAIDIPEAAKPRLPLVRVLATGPLCKGGYQVGDVAVFLIDPTTVDPSKEFVYGEVDFDGEVQWICPEGCLGPIIDNPESLVDGMTEGFDAAEMAKLAAEIKAAESEKAKPNRVLVPGRRN